MMYKQGDSLLIPFPFSDLSSTKKRPVLVLSNTCYNGLHKDVVVAAITSNVIERDYLVPITTEDLNEGQLKVESGVRADKIYPFSQQIVIRKFGCIKSKKMNEIRNELGNLFIDTNCME